MVDADRPHYRCNVQSAVTEVCALKLRAAHIDALKCTPFWYFIYAARTMDTNELQSYKKSDILISSIMKRSIARKVDNADGFQFGSIIVFPQRDDFELILGVRDGSTPIVVGTGTFRLPHLLSVAGLPGERSLSYVQRVE